MPTGARSAPATTAKNSGSVEAAIPSIHEPISAPFVNGP